MGGFDGLGWVCGVLVYFYFIWWCGDCAAPVKGDLDVGFSRDYAFWLAMDCIGTAFDEKKLRSYRLRKCKIACTVQSFIKSGCV